MKTLYIECNMGAAGDMLMGALLEIAPEGLAQKISELAIPGVAISAEKAAKCGVTGTHVHVLVKGEEEGHDHHHDHGHHHEDHDHHHGHDHCHDHHHHEHHSLADIEAIIDGIDISDRVRTDAKAIYKAIADAESTVHGEPVSQIHFHEVGAMDAVADVVGNCMLIEAIGADRIIVSPINTGSGTVRCAHGILPVPAPATAEILKGAEYYSDGTDGELCTPTGAAILQHFATAYGQQPQMKLIDSGTGVGNKDFDPKANIVRVFLGDTSGGNGDSSTVTHCASANGTSTDKICELSANIDDMTGEELGFAMERLLTAGAVDVYFVPIVMKKSRPAVKLSCLCRAEDADAMAKAMFKHTKTAGIRRQDFDRYVLDRYTEDRDGLRVKTCSGYGVSRRKAEFDDLAEMARAEDLSLDEARAKGGVVAGGGATAKAGARANTRANAHGDSDSKGEK
ncbi:nickel pincer cofactor biosynthesis protein LarC [Aminicella lysinilytica]|uniref:Pyridinium-3,5-bisthiocarboxylic acid mononucleotide nickel insertion protein n=1 Tax=Aminicella lysinilytica TaxID=433323 RepID=A0A4R6Q4L5_9FIRM|nr:nickel pincer cofactor biosynthesis protein LarC [Aminicella lysinilytica]TDP57308.1 hypothetical protein EV211_11332 [Aminicella lysinilytica]